jgi:hypothetical protein
MPENATAEAAIESEATAASAAANRDRLRISGYRPSYAPAGVVTVPTGTMPCN